MEALLEKGQDYVRSERQGVQALLLLLNRARSSETPRSLRQRDQRMYYKRDWEV